MQWPPLTEFIHRPGSITSLYTFPPEYTSPPTHKYAENTLWYRVYKPANILAINTKPTLEGILTQHTPLLVNRSLKILSTISCLHPLFFDEISPSFDVVLTLPRPHHNSPVTTSRPLVDHDGIPLPCLTQVIPCHTIQWHPLTQPWRLAVIHHLGQISPQTFSVKKAEKSIKQRFSPHTFSGSHHL